MRQRVLVGRRELALVAAILGILLAGQAAAQSAAIPAGTVVAIRTVDAIESSDASSESEYAATLDDSLVVGGTTLAPVGTPAVLRVVEARGAGAVSGRASLSLRLVAVTINGQRVALETGDATMESKSQTGRAVKNSAAGAALGAALGFLLGGEKGALKGAASGAVVGATVAVLQGQEVNVPAETRLSFTLSRSAAFTYRP